MSKTKFTLLTLLISIVSIAQNGINYKAIIKDSNSNVIANQNIIVQFSILQGVAQTNVYQETHTPTTDNNGIIIINIGEGTTSDVFADIDWSADNHFLNVQIDKGNGLIDLGTTQFMHVPYAIQADRAVNVKGLEPIDEGNGIGWRLIGRNAANYDNIGFNAIDLSFVDDPNLGLGATGNYAFSLGHNGTASGEYALAFGNQNYALNDYAIAIGNNNTVSGLNSISIGAINQVSGDYSFAAGLQNIASENYTVALGASTTASGEYAIAMGNGTTASGINSTAMGIGTVASGFGSTAIGFNTNALGVRSTATGSNTDALGISSTAMGSGTEALGDVSTAMGSTTLASGINSTAMGNGTTASGGRSTAMGAITVASGIRSTAMGFSSEASGDDSTAMGSFTEASGDVSTAMGFQTVASGDVSTAIGNDTEASGNSSIAIGFGTTASGTTSTAMGSLTTASGIRSTAMGSDTVASGDYSTTMGVSTNSDALRTIALGSFNIGGGAPNSWVLTDPIFEIGNGLNASSRSNAVTVLKNGNVGIGTHTPQERLHISGGRLRIGTETIEDTGSNQLSVDASLIPNTDNAFRLGNSSNRWIGVWATDGTINTSDRRSKTNIAELEYGLNDVLKLNPVSFNWKTNPNNDTKLGLIAQDVLNIIPEVVKTHIWEKDEVSGVLTKKELNRLGVYYSDLIPVLIKAIQEQQKIINNEKSVNAKQNLQLEALLSRIEILETNNSN